LCAKKKNEYKLVETRKAREKGKCSHAKMYLGATTEKRSKTKGKVRISEVFRPSDEMG